MSKKSKNEIARIRYQLYRDLGYSVKDAQRLRWHGDITLSDVKMIQVKEPTRNERARERYQMLRKQGYSVKDAQRMRYKKTSVKKRIVKDDSYKYVRHEFNIDTTMNELRRYENHTVLTDHGFYAQTDYLKGSYGDMVQRIRDENKLSDKQAWYVAYHMTQNGKSYQETMIELQSNAEFENYKHAKKGMI